VTLSVVDLATTANQYGWLVPGHRLELVTELLRTLPKETRTRFIPLPDTARRIVDALPDYPDDDTDIAQAVRSHLILSGVPIERSLLRPDEVPGHLRPIYQVVDDKGTMLAAGRDPGHLAQRLEERLRQRLRSDTHPLERSGLTEWPDGDLPRFATATTLGTEIDVYPALVDQVSSVDLRVLATREEQAIEHWRGVRRLLRFQLKSPVRFVLTSVPMPARLALTALSNSTEVEISQASVVDDIVNATLDSIMAAAAGAPWSQADMRALVRFVQRRFEPMVTELSPDIASVLLGTNQIVVRLAVLEESQVDLTASLRDSRSLLRALVFDNSLTAQGTERLPDVNRYLQALLHRLEQLPADRDRDVMHTAEIHQLEVEAAEVTDPEIGWMIQELRVSLWAQHLGTNGSISPARIRRRIDR
jgi:ATP-dependent helicase HrpA